MTMYIVICNGKSLGKKFGTLLLFLIRINLREFFHMKSANIPFLGDLFLW